MFRLQSNVPLPKTIRPTAVGRRRKYPFEVMGIGQFFFVPKVRTAQINGHVHRTAKEMGRKFQVRQCFMRQVRGEWQLCRDGEPDAVLGVGVWRTE